MPRAYETKSSRSHFASTRLSIPIVTSLELRLPPINIGSKPLHSYPLNPLPLPHLDPPLSPNCRPWWAWITINTSELDNEDSSYDGRVFCGSTGLEAVLRNVREGKDRHGDGMSIVKASTEIYLHTKTRRGLRRRRRRRKDAMSFEDTRGESTDGSIRNDVGPD